MTLNEEVAVEVMGWEKTGQKVVDGFGEDYGFIEYWQIIDESGNELPQFEVREFRPDSDLNQARMVTEKGVEVLMELCPHEEHKKEWALTMIDRQLEAVIGNWKSSQFRALSATAEQICQAVLMAVSEARK